MEHTVEKKIIKAVKIMAAVLDEHLCSTQRSYELATSISDLADILRSEYNKRLIVLMPSNK